MQKLFIEEKSHELERILQEYKKHIKSLELKLSNI
jgi:hypothetical protein